jgi:hypothetical protein
MSRPHDNLSPLVKRYQALVVQEASLGSLEAALDLIDDIVAIDDRFREQIPELRSVPGAKERGMSQFGELLEIFEPQLKEFHDHAVKSRGDFKHRRMVYRVAVSLTFVKYARQALPEWSLVQQSLLLDAAQVLFHHAYFALEPGVITEKDRKILLEAFFMQFAELLPSADGHRVLSLCFDALGHPMLADRYAREALKATNPDSHEYLSLVQSAWGRLIEVRRFEMAMLLLMDEAPRVPPLHFAEFNELVQQTVEMKRLAKAS